MKVVHPSCDPLEHTADSWTGLSWPWSLGDIGSMKSEHDTGVLVGLGCRNKMPYISSLKQATFISHSSGDWEVQDQGSQQFNFW